MERLGPNLKMWKMQNPLITDKFQVISILRCILKGLIEIHTLGIIHNDLKLENICFTLN